MIISQAKHDEERNDYEDGAHSDWRDKKYVDSEAATKQPEAQNK